MIPPLPPDFLTSLEQKGLAGQYLKAMAEKPFRGMFFAQPLPKVTDELKMISGVPGGYFMPDNHAPFADPYWHGGFYYSQEPSAMRAVASLGAKKFQRILDLCAAPGGKTCQLHQKLSSGGILLSNEIIPKRFQILQENSGRLGLDQILLSSFSPETLAELAPDSFDLILVDAPCSGEGMFRKNPNTRKEWSLLSVESCALRQKEILHKIRPCLRSGGTLLYSTCTFNTRENQEVRDFLLESGDLILEEDELIFPWQGLGEGHYYARLRHRGDPTTVFERKNPAEDLPEPFQSALKSGRILRRKDRFFFAPATESFLEDCLMHPGILIGQTQGKEFVPHHFLGHFLEPRLFPNSLALNLSEASKIISGQTLPNPNHLKGITLLTFEGRSLGFAKAIPDRLQNLYPKHFRHLNLD